MKQKSEKLTDLCGCVWEIQEGIWVCGKRCPKHSKPKSKRPHSARVFWFLGLKMFRVHTG